MPRFWHSRTWRFGRVCFRWLRIAGWLLLLAAVCGLVYLNQVGLPDFLKRRLIEELHSRGIEFEYEHMRLDFYGGLVAEKVRFGLVKDTNAPSLFIESVGLLINPERLYQTRQLEIDSLAIQGGRLSLPVGGSNAPMTNLVVEGIEGRVSLLAGDVWQVQELKARSLGLRLQMTGTVTNASAIQNWELDTGRGRGARSWREYVRRAMAVADRLQFATTPVLKGYWRLDAADPMRALARLELNASRARTPWGDADQFGLSIRSMPAAGAEEILGAQVDLRLAHATTPWGKARELTLRTQTRPVEQPGLWPGAGLTIEAAAPDTRWGSAESLRLDFTLADVQTNLTGLRGQVDFTARKPRTKWASAEVVTINAHVAQLPAAGVVATDPGWGWWADLTPYELDWRLAGERIVTGKGELDRVEARGHWRAPDLAVDELTAGLLGGQLLGTLRVNVGSREATGQAAIDFDVKKLDRLLTPGALRWLGQFHWDQPPVASARGGVTLPPWTAGQVDWRAEVVPTLWLAGALTNQAGAFRDVRFDRARLDFQFTNQTWRLRGMVAERPEGRVILEHDSDERTKDYTFKIHSTIDVKALRPWLDEGGRRAFDFFEFKNNPEVDMELWGRWRALERTGFKAAVRVTNFTFRGEAADEWSAALAYTNRIVTFRDARLRRPEGEAVVGSGLFDLDAQQLFLTNGFSTVEPMAVLRAIGPRTAATMAPYQFLAPPKVWVNGRVHTRDVAQMDLQFHVEGGPFRWARFNLPQLAGDLHWVRNGLVLSNFSGGFYDGRISGGAQFDFGPAAGTEFGFNARVWESDFKKLMADITGRTNQLEGVLNGQLNVRRARSWDWTSWQGFGSASLRDGLIWDVPLFGFLTVPLNAVMPGLGHSRASDATATCTITNSLIRTEDLDIVANSLRLKYRGTVDFDTKVNARVEVEVLRDTGVLGKFINLALLPLTKLFEYKVTGTLGNPKPEPLYILPKVILFPLQPIKTLKDLFPGENPSTAPPSTNAPAVPLLPPP